MIERILPQFYDRYPDTRLCLHTDTGRKQMQELQRNDLDLALITNAEHLPGYVYLPVGRSWLAVVVREDSLLLSRAREMEGYPFPVIRKDELSGQPFVALTTVTNSGYIAHELCRKHGIKPNVVMEVNNVRSCMDAVECGYGCAMFMSIPLGSRRLRYLSLEDVEVTEQTCSLVYQADKKLTGAMRYLIQVITGREAGAIS